MLPVLHSDFNTENGKYVEEEIHLLPFCLNDWKYVVIRVPINVPCRSNSLEKHTPHYSFIESLWKRNALCFLRPAQSTCCQSVEKIWLPPWC